MLWHIISSIFASLKILGIFHMGSYVELCDIFFYGQNLMLQEQYPQPYLYRTHPSPSNSWREEEWWAPAVYSLEEYCWTQRISRQRRRQRTMQRMHI